VNREQRRIAQHFVEAERLVLEGERLVAHQRLTIAKRRRDGHHTELAVHLLNEMEESLRLHMRDRDRLRQQLTGNTGRQPFIMNRREPRRAAE
jgi:hypothetical protein